ncbi:MAG: methyltransferase domain-containing protein [Planctomycetes bacterium]|nr:methyltransferase domain-containing protein [Planctomycetota bacterium]
MDWVRAYSERRTPWDLSMVTPPLRALLRSGRHLHWGLPKRARVAVPGCGRGHDLRALSAAGMRVTGFDIVPDVVDEARALLRWNRASGKVLCRDVLGLAQEFGESFDLVYDYTCFAALPRYLRKSYALEMRTILDTGGILLQLAFPFGGPVNGGGPPYPILLEDLAESIGPWFDLVEDFAAEGSPTGRAGAERWFVWRVRG